MELKEKILQRTAAKNLAYISQKPGVYEAMEEYAKIKALALAKYVMENTCQDLNNDNKWQFNDDSWTEATDDQLYEKFEIEFKKQHTNKDSHESD